MLTHHPGQPRLLILSCAFVWLFIAPHAATAQGNRVLPPQAAPHAGYWPGFDFYNNGNFRDALAEFRDAAGSGLNFGGTPWVDSICYHAMMGECLYQMGELADALEQFTSALKVFLVHSNWMLRIDFTGVELTPEQNLKGGITWGNSARGATIGHFPDTFSYLQGRLDNQNVLRTGGVVDPPSMHPVHVAEIVRCTSLALSRRRLLLGPVCEYDPLTTQLLAALARRPGPPNHWSQSWVELQLGLAYAGANQIPQAVNELNKSLLVAGQYDHPLTGLGLLELGRLAFEQGKYDLAAKFCHEASISAAIFDRYSVLEEAFRIGAEAHLLSGQKGVYPPLAPAAASPITKNTRVVHVSILTSLAEQLCTLGNLADAAAAISQAKSEAGRLALAQGAIGCRANFQAARIATHAGDVKSGAVALVAALGWQNVHSTRLFHIGLVDTLYRAGGVTERIADLLFAEVLREPTRTDWLLDPLDQLAIASTPHPLPFEHWLELALTRKEYDKALNISDRIRRHRFFVTQPPGGRLVALRWLLEAPPEALTDEAVLQRQELLVKFPRYADLSRRAAQIVSQVQSLAITPADESEAKRQSNLLAELAAVSGQQEAMLHAIALERVPSELAFPPLRETREIQDGIPESSLLLSFLITSRNVHGFAVTKSRVSHFTVAQPAKVKTDVVEMLRQLGLHDRNQPVPIDDLKSTAWQVPAERLLKQLGGGLQPADFASQRELIIVPDGVLWYLPFEALQVRVDSTSSSLLSQVPLRYAPTLGLAIPDGRGHRPLARTAIVQGKLFPRDQDAATALAVETVSAAVPGTAILKSEPRPGGALFAATLDRQIVLKDQEDSDKLPFGWSPLALDAGKPSGTLSEWMQLPFASADQLVLPGFHTAAESSLKRGGTGDEIFLAVCGLMATGCRTALLSRWRVGGQSTIDLMREFVQELPHERADVAWRRSVQLAASRQLDPSLEPRIKSSSTAKSVKADHPFFWSGYLLVDRGVGPKLEKPSGAGGGANLP